jgi:serine/threonine protein kinase
MGRYTQYFLLISQLKIVKFAQDIASGMVYLHQLQPKVIHFDLKSMNVLIDNEGTAKLSDFGLSKVKLETITLTNAVGTPQWCSPELLKKEMVNEKTDVYSFAMVMYEMVANKIPFDGIAVFQGKFINTVIISNIYSHDDGCKPKCTTNSARQCRSRIEEAYH